MTHNCRRPDCDESFESELKYDIHLMEDHDVPWESIENYPRAPESR